MTHPRPASPPLPAPPRPSRQCSRWCCLAGRCRSPPTRPFLGRSTLRRWGQPEGAGCWLGAGGRHGFPGIPRRNSVHGAAAARAAVRAAELRASQSITGGWPARTVHPCPVHTHTLPLPPAPFLQLLIYGIPTRSSSCEALSSDIDDQVTRLAGEGPTQQELARYKKARNEGGEGCRHRQPGFGRCTSSQQPRATAAAGRGYQQPAGTAAAGRVDRLE